MTQNQKEAPRIRLGHGGGHRLTGESARKPGATIKRLLNYAVLYTRPLILVAALVLVSTFASLAGPILLGSDIFWSIWTSPIKVPIIPMAGANVPMVVKISAPN